MKRTTHHSAKSRSAFIWLSLLLGGLLLYGITQPQFNADRSQNLPEAGRVSEPAAGASGLTPALEIGSAFQSAGSPTVAADRSLSRRGESDAQSLRYGLLREEAPGEYVSPAGLRYVPMAGPEEHRLYHIERHLSDQPDRPGRHGVFTGDMPQFLRLLDDAYVRGQQGQAGTRRQTQGSRVVYEVQFDRQIGYVGGQQGQRDRHPPAHSIRFVLEGERVITAFPF